MAEIPAEFQRFTNATDDADQSVDFCFNSGTYAGSARSKKAGADFNSGPDLDDASDY